LGESDLLEVVVGRRPWCDTLGFDAGKLINRQCTRGKVVDEFFFIEGGGFRPSAPGSTAQDALNVPWPSWPSRSGARHVIA